MGLTGTELGEEGRLPPVGAQGRLGLGRLEAQQSQVPRLVNEVSFQAQAKARLYLTLGREAEAGGS